MEKKNCSRCGTEKELSEFYRDKRRKNGRSSWCRLCWVAFAKQRRDAKGPRGRKDEDLRLLYGITIQDYERMLREQNKVCAICKSKERIFSHVSKKPQRLSVDHDHGTGKVRGLLCSRCNKALGLFFDDTALLTAATAYLIQHKEERDDNRGTDGTTPTGDPGTPERPEKPKQ
jgi:hypothetical protein